MTGETLTATIERVYLEDVGGDGEDKPVLRFHELNQGLVLNKTNSNALVELLGTSETEQWAGHKITMEKAKVEFQGRRVPAIRIADELPGDGPSSADDNIPI
jgi:hypothetical protein